jgi:hypothetical protein
MENINEIWRPIKGYEGLYQVSNLGRVKSLTRKNCRSDRFIKLVNDRKGYLIVGLYINGKAKHYKVHRLVAEAFIPNPDNLPEVNHKSEEKWLNTVWINEDGTIDLDKSNLEWCTKSYNCSYGTRIKKLLVTRKINEGKTAEKPVIQMTLDNKVVAIWPSASEAERNGFIQSNITVCCQGKRKTHKGYKWQYYYYEV